MAKIKDKINAKLRDDFNSIDWQYGPDYDPEKKVLRYGKYVPLRLVNGYDDARYGNPDEKKFLAFVLRNGVKGLGDIGAIGLSGYGTVKLGLHLKSKHDARKKKERDTNINTQ
ncbi:hypothetical protein [Guptibacillus hwajinpoensis]|uniref:hypothetical protein n=1 Tax=Guptibacillus hwajinpoensis TaxID=208199 RepID=UPI0024B39AED|nr:hypothetical protein [Pseudalkalibacillus hwajinpoensis]